jgi:hypothetical protein
VHSHAIWQNRVRTRHDKTLVRPYRGVSGCGQEWWWHITGDQANPGSHDGAGALAQARQNLARARAENERIGRKIARAQTHRQQQLIDAEVRETRRLLVGALRRHGTDAAALLDEDFLAVADRPSIVQAILAAALTTGAADACDLQLYDPQTTSLRMEALRGFSGEFAALFATVDRTQATACATALNRREAVLVDDVSHSSIFEGSPALEHMRAAGSQAVRSYPLLTADGAVFGVLSLHYRQPAPRRGQPDLVAASAAQALGSRWARLAPPRR